MKRGKIRRRRRRRRLSSLKSPRPPYPQKSLSRSHRRFNSRFSLFLDFLSSFFFFVFLVRPLLLFLLSQAFSLRLLSYSSFPKAKRNLPSSDCILFSKRRGVVHFYNLMYLTQEYLKNFFIRS